MSFVGWWGTWLHTPQHQTYKTRVSTFGNSLKTWCMEASSLSRRYTFKTKILSLKGLLPLFPAKCLQESLYSQLKSWCLLVTYTLVQSIKCNHPHRPWSFFLQPQYTYAVSHVICVLLLLQSSLCSEMASELRFALRCQGSTKPVRKKGPVMSGEEGRFMSLGPYSQCGFMGKEPLAWLHS